MKKFNASLNYLAGISSPTAANLTVQGLTEPSTTDKNPVREQSKSERNFNLPFSYLAGVSSPSAANASVQGVADADSKYFHQTRKSSNFANKVVEALAQSNPAAVNASATDPRSFLKNAR